MSTDLLSQLEQKVEHALEVIELLRLQIDELEQENAALKAEQEKWRHDLAGLLARFDQIDVASEAGPAIVYDEFTDEVLDEQFALELLEEVR